MPYNLKNTLRLPKEEEEIQTYKEIEEGVFSGGTISGFWCFQWALPVSD